MDFNKEYYAKLMLVGEYGVIAGSEALTIPLTSYKAQLANKDNSSNQDKAKDSASKLRELVSYIKSLPQNRFNSLPMISELENALKQGYYVHSNIPHGYGLGSSGVVSALIYDQFFEGKSQLGNTELRKDLATIESFFHGKSSGVDAMSCYLGEPLHFLSDGRIKILSENPLQVPGDYCFFLLDSKEVLDTGPLVKIFLEKMSQEDFKEQILGDYLPLIQKLIGAITGKLNADPALIFRAISDFQWNHFKEMIPESIEEAWITGQVSNAFYLKLNGSGGGFLLGIAHQDSKEMIETLLEGKSIIWL